MSSRFGMMVLLPILLTVLSGMSFYTLIQRFGGSPPLALSYQELLIFFAGLPIVLAAHEYLHSLMMQYFGASPRYGFWRKGLMFYAKAPGHAFKRNQYALIVLAPLLGICALILLGILFLASHSIVWVLALWGIVNASAANADVWITALVFKYPASAYVVDEQDGIRILLPQRDAGTE